MTDKQMTKILEEIGAVLEAHRLTNQETFEIGMSLCGEIAIKARNLSPAEIHARCGFASKVLLAKDVVIDKVANDPKAVN